MSQPNPYAAPTTLDQGAPLLAPPGIAGGLYRQGRLLVVDKNAAFPNRCVKSNQPADGYRLQRKLYWHHPAIFLSILMGWIPYVVLALVLRKKATLYIGVSEEWMRKRRMAVVVGWSLVLGGIVMFALGCSLSHDYDWAPYLFVLAFVLALGGAIYGLVVARLVAPTRITDDYVWLKGVHPEFLADLPVWDYGSNPPRRGIPV